MMKFGPLWYLDFGPQTFETWTLKDQRIWNYGFPEECSKFPGLEEQVLERAKHERELINAEIFLTCSVCYIVKKYDFLHIIQKEKIDGYRSIGRRRTQLCSAPEDCSEDRRLVYWVHADCQRPEDQAGYIEEKEESLLCSETMDLKSITYTLTLNISDNENHNF